ncbi:MAG: hypothetical protein ACXAC7_20010 [Candidatus Hodarchaeales archaeon]|jgi:hypothetical protein
MSVIIAVIELVIAIGIIGFWIMFYFTEYKNRKMSEIEYKHELSFPLPDLVWITPNLVIAAISFLLNQEIGYLFSIIAGSGMMFLGLIDLAFAVQNGKFKTKDYGFDAYMTLIIVVLMLIFGPMFILYGGLYLL